MMTLFTKAESGMKRLRRKFSTGAQLVLTLALMTILIGSGCAHYRVVSSDRQIVPLTANKPFTPSCNGIFVPDARWLEIRTVISDKANGQ